VVCLLVRCCHFVQFAVAGKGNVLSYAWKQYFPVWIIFIQNCCCCCAIFKHLQICFDPVEWVLFSILFVCERLELLEHPLYQLLQTDPAVASFKICSSIPLLALSKLVKSWTNLAARLFLCHLNFAKWLCPRLKHYYLISILLLYFLHNSCTVRFWNMVCQDQL
jgi:hypothetical protein